MKKSSETHCNGICAEPSQRVAAKSCAGQGDDLEESGAENMAMDCSGGIALVAMMQSTHLRDFHDSA